MSHAPDGTPISGWVGFDMDGTLSVYDGDAWYAPGEYGPPVPKMLARLKAHLAQGDECRIMTARASIEDPVARELAILGARDWCMEHVGVALAVTCSKDLGMRLLYDDRAVTVEANTGEIVCHPVGEWTP